MGYSKPGDSLKMLFKATITMLISCLLPRKNTVGRTGAGAVWKQMSRMKGLIFPSPGTRKGEPAYWLSC